MRFRDQLRSDLKAVVAERARAKAVERQAARRLGWQPKVLLAGGFTAALAASMVVVNGYGADPAWSVQKQDNGSITVHINDWTDPRGLEHELEKYVPNALVQIAPKGKRCTSDWYQPTGAGSMAWTKKDRNGDAEVTSWTVLLEDVTPGTTLVAYHEAGKRPGTVTAPGEKSTIYGMGDRLEVAKGDVGPCELVPDTE